MNFRKYKANFEGDRAIWVIMFFLSIFSIVSVYSSSCNLAYKLQGGDTEYYLKRQILFLIIGWVAAYFTHKLKPSVISGLSQLGIFVIIPALLFTMIFGNESRWIQVPILNSFQTSDPAKFILIIFLARLIANNQKTIKEFNTFVKLLIPIALVCGFIFVGNFSTSALVFVSSVLLLFVGRTSIKHLLLLAGTVIIFLGILWMAINAFPEVGRFGTWKKRIETYTSSNTAEQSKDAQWQSNQAKMAVATGGWFGKTPGKSTQRFFLPQAHNDFIYAIIIEEYGIFSGIFILSLYLALLFRAIQISNKSKTNFRKLTVFGISFMVSFQAMVNMGVSVGLLPVTGQTLPIISMGGTSVITILVSFGIIQAISRSNELELNTKKSEEFIEEES
ncbi:MAG: FtsW/RodA/SpoVE family cell cycle protein [Bacteroidota bacterium]|nr:FtsW/RodA/SpoVE family cell cycle protein [Bacteroidota bacterium]